VAHVSEIDAGLHAPTKIPKDIKMVKDEAPPSTGVGVAGMGGMAGGSPGGVFGGIAGSTGPATWNHPSRPARRASPVV
jgi:protein TonB